MKVLKTTKMMFLKVFLGLFTNKYGRKQLLKT